MRFDVLTLFPEMFSGYMTQSLLKLAILRKMGFSANLFDKSDQIPYQKF